LLWNACYDARAISIAFAAYLTSNALGVGHDRKDADGEKKGDDGGYLMDLHD
jgi:hypothetical protein